jgi:hypothetical protein
MDESERQKLTAEMHKVFTPGFPINQQDLFRGRIPQLNKILQTVPSPGRHPIIFGQRGVGKTSLVNILTQFFLPGQMAVKATCDGSDSFKSIWNRVFQKITIEFKEHSFGFSRQESEKKINLASFLGRENEGINGVGPADIAGVLALLKQRAIFVIDEFDRITEESAKVALADLIKNLSDNNQNVTLVLVGVGESISDLIGDHPSIGRNLVQVEMPLMADAEIKEIVAKGAEYLQIKVETDVLQQIAFLSAGFPHYGHLLGLSIAKACLIRDTKTIDLKLFDELACSLAVEDSVETYRNSFSKATRTSKQSRYPQILCACGIASHDERGVFRATDVVEAMLSLFKETVNVQAVVPALQAFTDADRGAILDKVPFGTQNHYRFREPMMRPFLRIKGRSFSED